MNKQLEQLKDNYNLAGKGKKLINIIKTYFKSIVIDNKQQIKNIINDLSSGITEEPNKDLDNEDLLFDILEIISLEKGVN